MQQVYLKRLTKQDITRSVAICTESVSSFWGVSITASGYVPIHICHEDNPSYFPEGITIHKGNQGEKDWRICGDKWKKLYDHQNPEEGDIMCVNKNNAAFSVKIIKKGTDEFTHMSKMFVGKDNYVVVQADEKKDESKYPLQQIFYGAPGTGKSNKTNKIAGRYSETIRTTFHPDSDYSTFVGSYKPTTTKEPVLGLNGKDTIQLIDPQTKEPLETIKIQYKFIKQAFLKAYIKAWQKMCNTSLSYYDTMGAKFTIIGVNDREATVRKEETPTKQGIENTWNNAWKDNNFDPKHESGSGNSLLAAVAQWIYNNIDDPSKDKFEEGWNKLITQPKPITTKTNGGSQEYEVTSSENDSLKITSVQNPKKDTIKDPGQAKCVIKGIVDILNSYDLPDFDEAWNKLKEDVGRGIRSITPQYLVIEEINRGNCAQIFGDIFQLLDRKKGFSEYPIEADEDIQNALRDADLDRLTFGKDGLKLPEEVKIELRDVFGKKADVIINKICKGQLLVLPKNLYIWATMNTSDQSLFPIDSAFKRRWDWTYMPIKEAKDKNYKIVLSDSSIEYNWWDFICAINNVINDVTSSEDKKLGYFFCKPCDDKNITASQFVNKVIFYLWNDVLKDYEMPKEFEYGETKKKEDSSKSNHMTFNDFYTDQEACIRQLMENLGVKPIAEEVKTEPATDDASTAATSEIATDDATASTAAIGTDESTEQTLF